MKPIYTLTAAMSLSCAAFLSACASTERAEYTLPLFEVTATAAADMRIHPGLRFYLDGQEHPPTVLKFAEGTAYGSAHNHGDDVNACKWAVLDALDKLQAKALQMEANAVVDIVSVQRGKLYISNDLYECHATGSRASVAFKGSFARLAW